jgi:hypothetical protein
MNGPISWLTAWLLDDDNDDVVHDIKMKYLKQFMIPVLVIRVLFVRQRYNWIRNEKEIFMYYHQLAE